MLKNLVPTQFSEYSNEIMRLQLELDKLKNNYSLLLQNFESLNVTLNNTSINNYIIINQHNIIHKIPLASIFMMEALDNYTLIYLTDGTRHMTSKTLQYWDDQLIAFKNFVRTHRSYTVNLDHLVSLDIVNSELVMIKNFRVKYSRRRKPDILRLLNRPNYNNNVRNL